MNIVDKNHINELLNKLGNTTNKEPTSVASFTFLWMWWWSVVICYWSLNASWFTCAFLLLYLFLFCFVTIYTQLLWLVTMYGAVWWALIIHIMLHLSIMIILSLSSKASRFDVYEMRKLVVISFALVRCPLE